METTNWLDGADILERIKDDSRKRRQAPIEFFCRFLEDIWMDNTSEEAMAQWQTKVEQFPWYADDVLHCLEAVIANPPPNLVDLMIEHGWLTLYNESDKSGEETMFTYEESLQWLREIRDRFKAVYDEASATIDDNEPSSKD